MQRQPVLLATLVGNVVEANRSAISAAGLELEMLLDDPHRLIEVDPTRFSQIIGNVLHNAIKFTPAGGRITVSSQEERSPTYADLQLVLRIADTGIGIDGARKQFCPIRWLHRRGQCWCGPGAEFTVRIPVILPPVESAATPSRTSRLDGQRVLLVDDNVDSADSMALFITQLGAEVRVRYDGISALELLREFDASLILLDIGMPEVDGYQTCERIRREGRPGADRGHHRVGSGRGPAMRGEGGFWRAPDQTRQCPAVGGN